jgi:hypothetical protein
MEPRSVFLSLMAIFGLAMIDGHASTLSPEEAMALAKSTLEERVGISASTIRFAYATEAEWPDSSLGCPEKGMSYQPVLTPGYVVSLQVNDRTYTVHIAGAAAVICNRAGMSGKQAFNARLEQALKPLNAAREDLAGRLNEQPSQIEITAIKRTRWPDASLGCPQPGEQYAQIETPGFVIKLEHGGNVYRYHTNMKTVILCEASAATGDNDEDQPLIDRN